MLQILVVDDEQEEREGIAFLIEEYGYLLQVKTASNGRTALNYLRSNPTDILFTDVRMPIMDGLNLAEQSLKLYPDMKVIIFSGFSEFEYAKTAITLGVSDYILKPVNVEKFKQVMEKVIQEITVRSLEKENRQIEMTFAKKYLISCAVNGKLGEMSPTVLPLDFLNNYQRMLLLEFDLEFFETADLEFEEEMRSLLKIPVDYLNLNSCQSLLLFPKSISVLNYSYQEISVLIHNAVACKYCQDCYVAVSQELHSAKDLTSALIQMEQLMEHRFFLEDTFVFTKEDNFTTQVSEEKNDDRLLENIRNDLAQRDIFSLRTNINFLFDKYSMQANFSHLYVKFIFSSLYKEIMTHVTAFSETELNNGIENIYKSNEFHGVIEIINQGINQLEQTSFFTKCFSNRDVEAVKQYVQQHYDSQLDLETLAAKVYLSRRYLSHIFIKETGYGLNKYIKTVRMEKARQMLENTHIKIVDICRAVGYSNVSYFCQTFREFYGETPEKYRQKEQ